MAEIHNLRLARKRAKRARDEQEAATNRLAYGQTKSDRTESQLRRDKDQRRLDQHRIITGDGK